MNYLWRDAMIRQLSSVEADQVLWSKKKSSYLFSVRGLEGCCCLFKFQVVVLLCTDLQDFYTRKLREIPLADRKWDGLLCLGDVILYLHVADTHTHTLHYAMTRTLNSVAEWDILFDTLIIGDNKIAAVEA